MSHKTGFYEGRLGIGLANDGGDGTGNPRFPLDVNGDIRLTGAILKANGEKYLGGLTKIGFDNMTELQNGNIGVGTDTPTVLLDISGNTKISGDLNIIGTLQMNGQSPTYSNWTNVGDDITRDSNVTVTGDLQLNGTLKDSNGAARIFSNWTIASNTTDIYRPSGNVGIGTTSPSTLLVVGEDGGGHATNVPGIHMKSTTSNTKHYVVGQDTTHNVFLTYQANSTVANGYGAVSCYGGNNNLCLQHGGGNVGIGTTSPGEKLSVNGSIQIKGSSNSTVTNESKLIFTRDLNDSDESEYIAQIYTANYAGPLILESGRGGGYVKAKGNSTTNHPLFTVNDQSDNEKFRVCGNGRVGIGTTGPGHKLELYESSNYVRLAIKSGSTGSMVLGTHNDGRVFLYNEKNSYIHFGTNNSERMRIKANGNVGIGTTTPLCALHIEKPLPLSSYPMAIPSANSTSFGIGVHQFLSSRFTDGNLNQYGLVMGSDGSCYYLQHISTNHNNYYNLSLNPKGGNVGIGTTSPGAPLEIKCITGNTNAQWDGAKGLRLTRNRDGYAWEMVNGYHNDLLFRNMKPDGTIYKDNVLMLDDNGNVGIGTTSPSAKLDIRGSPTPNLRLTYHGGAYTSGTVYMNLDHWSINTYLNALSLNEASSKDIRMCMGGGRVGIGAVNPGYPLEVNGGVSFGTQTARYIHRNGANVSGYDTYTGYSVGIYANHGIRTQMHLWATSDERIKTNIIDVPDNLALEQVRNIPCRYYNYIDTRTRGSKKKIGFIAQEVRNILPTAINIVKDIIPNEMRKLENISWEEIIDGSNKTYKLTNNLQDVSGVKYRFYVSNDPSGNITDEISKEVIGNADNTFTFEEKWNNVFCYGKEVDDFHTIDKQSLFALNFSATQELDRQQQADKAEIAELKTEVATLKAELAAIKAHLGI